jgi:hypothetical protein
VFREFEGAKVRKLGRTEELRGEKREGRRR